MSAISRSTPLTPQAASAAPQGSIWRHQILGLVAVLGSVGADRLAGWWAVGPFLAVVLALTWWLGRTPMRAQTSQGPVLAQPELAAGLNLMQQVLPVWQRQVDAARAFSEHSMGTLLESFAMVSWHVEEVLGAPEPTGAAQGHAPSLEQAERLALGQQVHDELEKLSVGVQSQDRLSQMLVAVTDDMQRLSAWLQGSHDPAAAHPQQWLDRLEASYTMEDMKASHHAQAAAAVKPTGVQFF